ncbi:hypothetical protein ASF69_19960 [Rhizobium sp. Leaf311]|nr:hypothetical protein ASF69_19960 [Rhizobium sp. Leaf311]
MRIFLTWSDLATSGASGTNRIDGFQVLVGGLQMKLPTPMHGWLNVKSETLTVKREIDLKHPVLK